MRMPVCVTVTRVDGENVMAEQLTTSGDTAVSGFQSITVKVFSLFQMGLGATDGLLTWRHRHFGNLRGAG
jgi:hypothetical protein